MTLTLKVAIDLVEKKTHLMVDWKSYTLCGKAIPTAWDVRDFHWIRQIGCRECRKEYAKVRK